MTMTIGTELEAVPRETPALPLTLPEGAPTTTPADTDLLADASITTSVDLIG